MRVDWVHPSWRDLVIETLAADPETRRHFLARCGVDGFAVALSGDGGTTGERTRPLLREDADWDALGDGLHHVCSELGEAEAVRLLGVLEDAGDGAEVKALAAIVLARLGWSGRAVGVDALAAWMPVAARLEQPPEPPAVAMTWLALEPAGGSPQTPAELERFADWLRLVELLREHQPQLLAGLGFPGRHEGTLARFVEASPLDEPVLEREMRIEALARVAELAPELWGRAFGAASALRFEDEPPEAALAEFRRPEPPPTGFPVDRVLRDL